MPYQIAVTPVWIDRATGDEVTLSDRPKLVSVLKQLQGNGASIILHGFNRTYRTAESGQGFEFWDAKYDQPITTNDPKNAEKKRSKSQFPNEKDFHTYTKSYQQQEVAYTEEKLTKGIELLARQGLYPLAFEVPHDAISQKGYEVISKHVSKPIWTGAVIRPHLENSRCIAARDVSCHVTRHDLISSAAS
nr:DUF2334 domain-containing protein [Bacillus pumilus]